jgi:hypothetical protein
MMRHSVFAFLVALPVAIAQTPSTVPARGGSDVIHMKTGPEVSGTIAGRDGRSLKVQIRFATGVVATNLLPLSGVDSVDFAATPAEPADNLAEALKQWRAQRDFLDIPKSPAGATGLRAAEFLLESPNPDAAKSAAEILDEISRKDWDVAHKDNARALTVESLRRSGRRDESIKAARAFLAGQAAAGSKAMVSYFLARALIDDYTAFLEENPRWDFDPVMRPKRDALYNEILDRLLAPYLSYGAPPDYTAKSLLAASDFLEKNGDHEEAVNLAQDIVVIFPKQPEATSVKTRLEPN